MALLELKNVYVDYPVYGDCEASLRRVLLKLTTRQRIYKSAGLTVVRALTDINFSLHHGDRLGLIGENGAGKSTLLKTLGGFYAPASGNMKIEGHVSTLFDVCMGMDMERTGYDNIYFMGLLLGLSRQCIKNFIPDIEDFSELGEFLSMPMRTYSAGMRIRLGFALVTCLEPEILLLDEAIGAGDAHFLEKAAKRAKQLYDRASILVIASHDNNIIREFCNKALWLHKGRMVRYGEVESVLQDYENHSADILAELENKIVT